jgi:hypothetical protein
MIHIDRILRGVIRERMFGEIINRKKSLLVDKCERVDKSALDTFGGWELTNARRMTACGNRTKILKAKRNVFF